MKPGSTLAAVSEATTDALFAELLPALARYGLRRGLARSDAEDLAAEAAGVMWRRRAEIPGTMPDVRLYAYGIARQLLRRHRAQGRSREVALEAHTEVAADGGEFDAVEVRALLHRLRERDRELLLLVFWDGLTTSEAGALLGLGPAAAAKRYRRALDSIRHGLSAEDNYEFLRALAE